MKQCKPLHAIIGDQLTVLCVLWVTDDGQPYMGRSYNWTWVENLYHAVQKHLSIPHRFICLSNSSELPQVAGIEVIELNHNWPAWWSKMECFRPDIPGDRFLYVDLDNIPIGNLDDLVFIDSPFIGINPDIADKSQWDRLGRFKGIASGVMAWDRDKYKHLYGYFSDQMMTHYIGDQDAISHGLATYEYGLFPDKWIKVLKHAKTRTDLFKGDCRVLCCSPGNWRPDKVVEHKGDQYQWVNRLWKTGYIDA